MSFFKKFTGSVVTAKDFVVEKKKKTDLINKLRNAIKNEKIIADKAYLALGRYYYNNLRDDTNPVTESRCCQIEEAEVKIEQARAHLTKIYEEEANEALKAKTETSAQEEVTDNDKE